MRIISLRLKKETTLLLREVARLHAKRDTGFVEDLYSLMRLRGVGIPTKSRIQSLCDFAAKKTGIKPMILGFIANKRALLFQKIVKMAYFQAMCRVPNTISATERFIVQFTKLHNKVRQAQCLTCPLMKDCEFGKQYGKNFVDITYVIDPDFDKKVHADCPELPQIGTMNQVAIATKQWEELLEQANSGQAQLADMPSEVKEVKKLQDVADKEEDPSANDDLDSDLDEEDFDNEDIFPKEAIKTQGGSGTGDVGGFAGSIINVSEQMIEELNTKNLSVFELGKKFSLGLQKGKKNKFKPVAKLDRKQKTKQMESVSDISKLVPSEHGLPDEVFDGKLDRKQLRVQQNLQRQEEKQLLYLLIDNSVSMDGQFPGAANLMCSRGAMASILGIALCRHVLESDGMIFLRFFATSTTSLYQAKGKEEFVNLENILTRASYNGSGTMILKALSVAVKDIEEAKAKGLILAKAELLIITDCEDRSVTADNIQTVMKGIPINVLDVAGKNFNSPAFKATAAKYYKADETQIDVNRIIDLI